MVNLRDYDKAHRKAVKALDKFIKEEFTEEEQEELAFYNDEYDEREYRWIFEYNGRKYIAAADLQTGVVKVK